MSICCDEFFVLIKYAFFRIIKEMLCINYISSNILSWIIIEKKKHLATWGLEPASPVKVNRHATCCRVKTIMNPKKMGFFNDVP